jgi:hypothetical protein
MTGIDEKLNERPMALFLYGGHAGHPGKCNDFFKRWHVEYA